MRFLDITQLLVGKAMTFPCILFKEGIRYRVSALVDIGAYGYAFIDYLLLKIISRTLTPFIQTLKNPISVKDYNVIAGRPITQFCLS